MSENEVKIEEKVTEESPPEVRTEAGKEQELQKQEQEGAQEQVNPFAAAPAKKKMAALIGIYVAVIGSIFTSATLSTLLPVAAAEIGGTEYYSLASTVTGIISIAAMPLWGYLAARNPAIKRPLFAISVFAGAVSVFIRAIAPSMAVIIVASIPYGLVSAGIFVLGYAMIRDMYDPVKAGSYMGICGTVMMVSMLIGPIGGGIVMDMASWRLVCHIIWPFFLVGGLIMWFGAPKVTKEEAEHLAHKGGKFDFSGTIAVVVFLACLICGLSLGTSFVKFGTLASNALFIAAAISLIWLIVVIKKKQADAIIPATAFKNKNVVLMFVANFATMFHNMAVFFFLPTYCIYVIGAAATEAGLATACLSVAGIFLAPIFGKMIGKSGNAKGILAMGSALRVIIYVALVFILVPTQTMIVIYIVMLIAGVYNVTQNSAFSVGPQVQVPAELRVQGNSVVQVGQNLGGSVGTAVYTVILGIFGVAGGMPIALITGAAFAAIAFICSLGLKKLDA